MPRTAQTQRPARAICDAVVLYVSLTHSTLDPSLARVDVRRYRRRTFCAILRVVTSPVCSQILDSLCPLLRRVTVPLS